MVLQCQHREIHANQPHIIVQDMEKKHCYIIDMPCLSANNAAMKILENFEHENHCLIFEHENHCLNEISLPYVQKTVLFCVNCF